MIPGAALHVGGSSEATPVWKGFGPPQAATERKRGVSITDDANNPAETAPHDGCHPLYKSCALNPADAPKEAFCGVMR
jgi:hypothetical protein